MSKVKTLLNEIAQYPFYTNLSARRVAKLLTSVMEECKNTPQISLYADSSKLYMRNNINLPSGQYLYLMRQARRSHGSNKEDRSKRKRWTFCWSGSALLFNENASGAEINGCQPLEFVVPEVECSLTRGSKHIVSRGPVIDVIRELSINKRGSEFYINSGMRTKHLSAGKPITAHFAIVVADASGKYADRASHPEYSRKCDREVMQMAKFKVTFSLNNGEVDTKVTIE